jgi:uncharacterized membrane protein
MFTPPPVPPWDGLHPLVVHFPVALLLVAPLLVVLSLVVRRHATGISIAAFVLMLLGVAGAVVAVSTGEAAGELVERTDAISKTLERHAELAETARTVFAVLLLVYGIILCVPAAWRRVRKEDLPGGTVVAAKLVFLAVYAACTLILANTAHLGGVLVHTHGVRAMMGGTAPPAETKSGDHD